MNAALNLVSHYQNFANIRKNIELSDVSDVYEPSAK